MHIWLVSTQRKKNTKMVHLMTANALVLPPYLCGKVDSSLVVTFRFKIFCAFVFHIFEALNL